MKRRIMPPITRHFIYKKLLKKIAHSHLARETLHNEIFYAEIFILL